MNRKIDELKRNLDTQITESINSAIHDSILPSIQNSFSGQNSGLGTNVDSRSSRLSRNTEGKKHQSVWENTKCRAQSNSNNHPQSKDCSLSSLDCRDDHDRRKITKSYIVICTYRNNDRNKKSCFSCRLFIKSLQRMRVTFMILFQFY